MTLAYILFYYFTKAFYLKRTLSIIQIYIGNFTLKFMRLLILKKGILQHIPQSHATAFI